jgi:hypothetical protein
LQASTAPEEMPIDLAQPERDHFLQGGNLI